MYQKALTLITILHLSSVFAKDVWIHAGGVDTASRSQNFTYFYEEVKLFQEVCASSERHPECHSFIDSRPELADKPSDLAVINLPSNLTKPTKSGVLALFKAKLLAAKAGDQVILSLNDHGSPTKIGNSCIYLSGSEYICETDLAPILKLRPQGVKVLINADGCFSGAFTDLSNKDVCTTVWSDRRLVGTGGSGRLWYYIKNDKPTTLANLIHPAYNTKQYNHPIVGSQSIMTEICKEVRPVLLGTYNYETYYHIFSNFLCENPKYLTQQYSNDDVYKAIASFSPVVKAFSKITCESVGFSGEVCNEIMSLSTLGDKLTKFQTLFEDFQKLKKKNNECWNLEDRERWAYRERPENQSKGTKIGNVVSEILGNKREEKTEKELKEDFYSFKKLSGKDRKIVLEEIQKAMIGIRAVVADCEDNSKKLAVRAKEVQDAFVDYNSSPLAKETWRVFSACFMTVYDEQVKTDKLSAGYMSTSQNGGRGLYPRTFKQEDYEDAQSCEKSFRFR